MMTKQRQALFWVSGILIFVGFLHVFSQILLPFVLGMAIAYFLDPVADWLENHKLSRTLAAVLILLGFFVSAVALMMLLFPLLQRQVIDLLRLLPKIFEIFWLETLPWLEGVVSELPPETLADIRNSAKDFAGSGIRWMTTVAANLWSGGVAFFNLLSLLVITPIVSFYMLRDWDIMISKVDLWLPRHFAQTVRQQAIAIDQTLAAFVRGQSYVCLVLAMFYGIGLTAVGLKSGLLVGLGAGLISFIPYLGATLGLAVGLGIALFQFSEILTIGIVVSIFIVGQSLESYVLTPRFVGSGVGLHPVWMIFALLAGGALLGFTGVLIAVPGAAVIGVLTRFAISRYLASSLYDSKFHTDSDTSA